MEIYFTPPEISEWCTANQLREIYNVSYKGDGWYTLENGDYALIINRHGKSKIHVWIKEDPRDTFEKVLDLPTFN